MADLMRELEQEGGELRSEPPKVVKSKKRLARRP
jgi:hypothetical protein